MLKILSNGELERFVEKVLNLKQDPNLTLVDKINFIVREEANDMLKRSGFTDKELDSAQNKEYFINIKRYLAIVLEDLIKQGKVNIK